MTAGFLVVSLCRTAREVIKSLPRSQKERAPLLVVAAAVVVVETSCGCRRHHALWLLLLLLAAAKDTQKRARFPRILCSPPPPYPECPQHEKIFSPKFETK